MGTSLLLLLPLLLLGAARCSDSKYIAYNTSRRIDPDKINVHLVAHTHDDVGWLKTVDQYYVGSNNDIQGACVQNVLDSIVPALLLDKNRRFIYVEMAFFQRWWREQSDEIKDIVKKLVSSGQLEFANGGICMHDEAAAHYIDMIDQTTLGHQFLKQEFGITPRIGWQIDPFGHSAVQAYLLGAEVGFDAVYFARIDYQDRAKRKDEKRLEVVWRGSKTFGSSSQIFAGAFPVNYDPPSGFSFEVNDDSPIVQDDVLLFDYNVQERVDDFVNEARSQASITRTNHIMWTMGADFKYQYANSWFRQMDKLIHYVNLDGRVNALYSTPSFYTDAKYGTNEAWSLKIDDYFPYADGPNEYWTGYFTSRPALKGYVRIMSGYYLAARQLEFYIGKGISGPTTDLLGDALAIVQHHDAITGTSKQHVADDYAKRLFIGYQEAAKVVQSSLACLTESGSKPGCDSLSTKFEQCPLLNISYCPATEIDLSSGNSLVVVVYNSLGWKRKDVIRIPVSSEAVAVHDSEGKEIESQLIPVTSRLEDLRSFYAKANLGASPSNAPQFWLAFVATVPPLGFNAYIVSRAKEGGHRSFLAGAHLLQGSKSSTTQVGSGNLKLGFDAKGNLIEYINSKSSVKIGMNQSYAYYASQRSGAYVFRPNSRVDITNQDEVPMTVFRGPIFEELHLTVNSWISQITRVYKEKEHAEIEFTIGPIPDDDWEGKEVITRITTSMITNKTFYTDSNGRDFIKRIRDYRSDWDLQVHEPIAGNYYPINLGIYIQDKNTELSVLVDRAVGGSSILDGQIELMLHRRLFFDDYKGVGEALNEKVCDPECHGLTIQGKLYFQVDPLGEGAKWRRKVGQELYSPFLLAFAEQEGDVWTSSHVSTFSAMDSSYSLPDNVAIVTLQELEDGMVLLRLAHLFEAGEDKDLSAIASVDVRKIFPEKRISKMTEMNLSANQGREEMEKKRLSWKVKDAPKEVPAVRVTPVDPSKLVVELGPMEIRTFVIKFDFLSLKSEK